MLWAVTGQTAAELVSGRSSPVLPNMGLQTWSGPRVRKHDVTVAKNYLRREEIEELDRVVVMYLDYAEDQARRRRAMTMADWETKLDSFLSSTASRWTTRGRSAPRWRKLWRANASSSSTRPGDRPTWPPRTRTT